jgi:YebC/PmpR family DNA-binding regulatory protein
MSGHNKWSKIKHVKEAADAKKGAVYTKLIKEITASAREGGGNTDSNSKLRMFIAKAKEQNMPLDNIERAIKRGTGELPGVVFETVNYEAYGPGGVAILMDTLTDNKNRCSAEIKNILSKKGGNMASAGSVSWMFSKKGSILVDKATVKEDDLIPLLDAGAEDVKSEDPTNYEVVTSAANFEKVKSAMQAANIPFSLAEVTMVPSSTVKVTGDAAKQLLTLIEALEEHDDVQNVYANFDIPDEILEQMGNE